MAEGRACEQIFEIVKRIDSVPSATPQQRVDDRAAFTLCGSGRRVNRPTTGYSKKLENFRAAIGLYFGYYNLVKIHSTLRTTPAMAAGVVPNLWTVADLVEKTDG